MKKLVLVRHGKAQKDERFTDRERPLKNRGYRDAELITEAFKLHDRSTFLTLSSPAVRALETARCFKKNLDIADVDFNILEGLYTFSSENFINVIRAQNDAYEKMMVVGHNPAVLETAIRLGNKNLPKLPTTGLVVIVSRAGSWQEISKAETVLTLIPKMFK